MNKTNRRDQVEALIEQGYSVAEISRLIHVTEACVRYHREALYEIYCVDSHCSLIARLHMGRSEFKASRIEPKFPKLRSVA